MKHTIKELSAKIEKYCIEVDQMFNPFAKPFKGWKVKDYRDTAAKFKRLLWYFQDVKTNFPDAIVEIKDGFINVNYGKGSANIMIDDMMNEILIPEIDQYFQLIKSPLAA